MLFCIFYKICCPRWQVKQCLCCFASSTRSIVLDGKINSVYVVLHLLQDLLSLMARLTVPMLFCIFYKICCPRWQDKQYLGRFASSTRSVVLDGMLNSVYVVLHLLQDMLSSLTRLTMAMVVLHLQDLLSTVSR